MELYIRIKDGQPFEHPIFGDNFRQAFPNIDTNNLPPEFAKFVRVAAPAVGVFEVYEACVYELVDGVYTDVHNVRPMTAEEKAAKIEQARANLRPNWTLNEETLQAIMPPRPTTGGPWRFDGVTNDWVIMPPRPTVKGAYPYKFNMETNQWVESAVPPFPSWVPSEDGLRYVAPTARPEGQYRWDEPTLSWVAFNV
jgi:hypothetical protein